MDTRKAPSGLNYALFTGLGHWKSGDISVIKEQPTSPAEACSEKEEEARRKGFHHTRSGSEYDNNLNTGTRKSLPGEDKQFRLLSGNETAGLSSGR
jgi:hypothetical protein